MTSLREDFDLPGIPLRLWVRKGANPYADKDDKKSALKRKTLLRARLLKASYADSRN